MRIALGLSYRGCAYQGWQSQPGGATVQDHVERALREFTGASLRVVCAGRTDAGVHALQQVVHFDSPVRRGAQSWVRGLNTFLPPDISVLWSREPGEDFHAQKSARSRRYRYVLVQHAVRPALLHGLVGWTHHRLDAQAMREGAAHLLGEHDFTSLRASSCQARSPCKTVHGIDIELAPDGRTWSFDFHANAFLHHMVRNIMGCLIAVGSGARDPAWIAQVLSARERAAAAPTFMPDGLYFAGPAYAAQWQIPEPVLDLPRLLA
ncbi:tRNA pseudouridine(38-40) synthase TruA [Thiomonas sp.]|uniref:tRNA pseudouridine(38-40) synthase TruA n=1 Tax=Thiomonas sp. TaxID=2047785 RepID=UPI0026066A79|nr:tRNA pseudouridine(38-40) synthase TruA [Thiomonas sp.]